MIQVVVAALSVNELDTEPRCQQESFGRLVSIAAMVMSDVENRFRRKPMLLFSRMQIEAQDGIIQFVLQAGRNDASFALCDIARFVLVNPHRAVNDENVGLRVVNPAAIKMLPQ